MLKVLDDELGANGGWLVGGKCSAADLSYVPFHSRIGAIMAGDAPVMGVEFPRVEDWYQRMLEREPVIKVLKEHKEALKKVVFPTGK